MDSRQIVRVAFLAAVGLALFVFETMIPRPLPWLRVGLANIATLVALYEFGVKEAFLVTITKAVLGSLIVGGLFNPSFLFSFCGGLASTCAMAIVFLYFKATFSVIGVSVWGAFLHNMTQLAVAAVLFIHRWELFFLLPYFLFSAVATGIFTGALVFFLLRRFSWGSPSHVSAQPR